MAYEPRTVSLRSRGDHVRTLHLGLLQLDAEIDVAELVATEYGRTTRLAVADVQREAGLTVNGALHDARQVIGRRHQAAHPLRPPTWAATRSWRPGVTRTAGSVAGAAGHRGSGGWRSGLLASVGAGGCSLWLRASSSWSSRMMIRQAASRAVPWSTISPGPGGEAQLVAGVAAVPAGGAERVDQFRLVEAAQEVLRGAEDLRGAAHRVGGVVLVAEHVIGLGHAHLHDEGPGAGARRGPGLRV